MSLATFGPRFESALTFACSKHAGQTRKGNGAPYITHVIAVASLVGEYGGDEDQAIAALLHDVVEDCDVSAEEIAALFGARVASIVTVCTDATTHPKPPWQARKEAHVEKVRAATADAKLVIACDKLHNTQSIVRDRRRPSVGESVWSRFSTGREGMVWYLQAMREALSLIHI